MTGKECDLWNSNTQLNMKANNFLGIIASIAALSLATAACEEDKEDLGAPSVELDQSEISLEQAGGAATVQLTATRDWKATTEQDWISINPKSGDASSKAVTVEVTVLENTGLDREGYVKFDIGLDAKTLTVKQKGIGSAEDLIVYKNDFDKEEAQKTYGTGTSWPYLDQFEGWKNAAGTGAGSEAYSFNAMSVRANSTSNSTYSDYEGSGSNNLFFGASAYFAVTGIKLPSGTDYSLTFGTEKYSQDNGSLFKHSEFHVYVSNDGKKWVELGYSFPNGDKEGRWDLATSNFTVPSGTTTLGIYVKADVASSYRIDDLCLSVASVAGTAIDFSKGIDLGTDDGGGDNPDVPGTKMTLAQMLTAADDTVVESEEVLVGAVTTNGFVVTDGTSSIYVYQNSTPEAKVGDKVKFTGTKTTYYGLPEITSPKTTIVSSGNTVTYPSAKDITATFDTYTASVAEYVTYTAKVVKNGSYTNFEVEGATKLQGALSSAPSSLYSTFAEGDKVQVTGFFNTINTNSNLLNVIATEVKVLEKGEGGGDNPGEEGKITWSGSSVWDTSTKNQIVLKTGTYTITALKNDGSTAPTVNATYNDCRVYAKGTITVETTGAEMKTIVFNISTAGLKRLATVTVDNGTVAEQKSGDKTVTWIGSSKKVTFTVGDKAEHGSDGNAKAGQLDFDSIVIK